MKIFIALIMLLCFVSSASSEVLYGTFFIVRYEGFKWSPCAIDPDLGFGTCLSIACPADGCSTPSETIICNDVDCILGSLKRRGRDHLTGVYKVKFRYSNPQQTEVKEMKVIESFDVVDK